MSSSAAHSMLCSQAAQAALSKVCTAIIIEVWRGNESITQRGITEYDQTHFAVASRRYLVAACSHCLLCLQVAREAAVTLRSESCYPGCDAVLRARADKAAITNATSVRKMSEIPLPDERCMNAIVLSSPSRSEKPAAFHLKHSGSHLRSSSSASPTSWPMSLSGCFRT